MKFRKKPVVIEAAQWFKDGDHPNVKKWNDNEYRVTTLEGAMIVTPGDWIITGVKGEYYPCKPDIFEMTYAPFYTTPPKQEPRNFCPRCGKRTADLTVIHTCTPPEGGHQ